MEKFEKDLLSKNISITGDETIEELAMKVNEVDLMEHKLGVCTLIITHLELTYCYSIGAYTYKIALSKEFPPRSPDHIAISLNKQKEYNMEVSIRQIREVHIETFLFFLKKIDENCYVELVKRYDELTKKLDRKETLTKVGNFAIIIAVIILLYNLVKVY